MSKIDDLIKSLQTKKKKIDYLSYIADILKNDTKCIDYKEVKAEVLGKLEPLILGLMERIESDLAESAIDTDSVLAPLTKVRVDALVLMADRILTKGTTPIATVEATPATTTARQERQSVSDVPDKMNFAMNHRHLANQKVSVMNDQNVTIEGLVVGLDAPNVIVKTTSGPTIKVPVEKVVLQ
jgi:hypothetical protein